MIPKYKDIVDLMKKGATVEAQEKIMELREGALELQEENFDLKEQVRTLEKALSEKATLHYEAPFYWKINGSDRDGPFCQQCNDNSDKQIRLQNNGNDYWDCRTCKQGFSGKNHKEIDIAQI